MSPSGSFIAILDSSPARLDQARDKSPGTEVAQCDAGEPVLAIETARPARHLASIAHPRVRRVARQFSQLQRRREPFLHRLALVARNRFEPGTSARILLAQPSPSIVLLD